MATGCFAGSRRARLAILFRMETSRDAWKITTHDWSRQVDRDHLAQIQRNADVYARKGTIHLILEVLAYAVDEAEHHGRPAHITITVHSDGSVSVADNGRGTDTRTDDQGRTVRKPVMATKDIRFFDSRENVGLPDGLPRRGMSVVAALSTWLAHTNRRLNGSWTQRYEHGIPVTGLTDIPGDGTTGTIVHFLPDADFVKPAEVTVGELRQLAKPPVPSLTIEIREEQENSAAYSSETSS